MASESIMPTLRLYSRQGCHLCEVLLEQLLPEIRGKMSVEVVDIDTNAEWRAAYNERIPVLEYDGEFLCQYHLDMTALAAKLREIEAS